MELMKTFVYFEYINYEFLFRQKMSWLKKIMQFARNKSCIRKVEK